MNEKREKYIVLLRGYHDTVKSLEKSIQAMTDVFRQMDRDNVYCSCPDDYKYFDEVLDRIDIQYIEALKNINEKFEKDN